MQPSVTEDKGKGVLQESSNTAIAISNSIQTEPLHQSSRPSNQTITPILTASIAIPANTVIPIMTTPENDIPKVNADPVSAAPAILDSDSVPASIAVPDNAFSLIIDLPINDAPVNASSSLLLPKQTIPLLVHEIESHPHPVIVGDENSDDDIHELLAESSPIHLLDNGLHRLLRKPRLCHDMVNFKVQSSLPPQVQSASKQLADPGLSRH